MLANLADAQNYINNMPADEFNSAMWGMVWVLLIVGIVLFFKHPWIGLFLLLVVGIYLLPFVLIFGSYYLALHP